MSYVLDKPDIRLEPFGHYENLPMQQTHNLWVHVRTASAHTPAYPSLGFKGGKNSMCMFFLMASFKQRYADNQT